MVDVYLKIEIESVRNSNNFRTYLNYIKMLNILRTKYNLNYGELLISYRAVNTFRLGYRLLLCREITASFSKIHEEHACILCGQTAESCFGNFTAGGTYSNHWTSMS